MLRDPDSKVVSNSVVALNEIMMREGGIVLNTNICLRKVEAGKIFTALAQHKVTHFCGAPNSKAYVEKID